ncbi:uncharacterized protein LY89DRAFT_783518 [Mollisia scopiformis]|uniref:FAD-binding FR-type domain-containing protein n=1 Tax=Mollisia scopiformis TaxID=149040 RepID=A0A194X592_MOLSC|nr:uncharacterized protein LY89DRAFT_783518 [Mollisia scopiformis]KUJ15353.1 hypothetical protein LY89DRAFT_783518 [Mollisia scopiformis]
MKLSSLFWTAWVLASSVLAGTPFQGSINGMPVNPYYPFCAMTCLRSIYGLTLSCSTMDAGTLGMMKMETTSACWAENTPYLTSLAWCMNQKCAEYNNTVAELEYFWETEATGQSNAGQTGVPPKWSYSQSLANVSASPPTTVLAANATWLNSTSLVNPLVYLEEYSILTMVQRETAQENVFGIALLVVGFGSPIVFTWLGYVPLISSLSRKLKPYLIWPSLIGTYSVRPLPYLLGNVPTRGQSLYIALFFILNIVLTSVRYESRQPNAWYANRWDEIMAYVMYRTGALAYIFAPLIWLFAGRNNFLLWITNWSHSTFLLLHRWIARAFTLQAILHSLVAVVLYQHEGSYDSEVKQKYWIWGIVATLLAVILTFGSGLFVRKFAYEFFLIQHIVLSVIIIIAMWYHAMDLYAFLGGYQDWLIAISVVWMFDRLGRILRIAMVGAQRAKVTQLGGDYVRIDIPNVRWGIEPGKHVYVYFPTLHPLRPWENHPFSVLQTALVQPSPTHIGSDAHSQSSAEHADQHHDVEKTYPVALTTKPVAHTRPDMGLTLYVRKGTGATKQLASYDNLLTFIEGPYPNTSTGEVLRADRLLLISGGIGITGLLPYVNYHWNVKLAWSVREAARPLVNDLGGTLSSISDKDIRIGSRFDIKQLLQEEMNAGWARVGVVVCGPGGLCDEVRAAVSAAARNSKTEFDLEVEAYSW